MLKTVLTVKKMRNQKILFYSKYYLIYNAHKEISYTLFEILELFLYNYNFKTVFMLNLYNCHCALFYAIFFYSQNNQNNDNNSNQYFLPT